MRYLPKSPAERAEMLREIGAASSIDDLLLRSSPKNIAWRAT